MTAPASRPAGTPGPSAFLVVAVLAGVLMLAVLGAFVVLELNDRPTDALVNFAGPILTGLVTVGVLGQIVTSRTDPLREKVDEAVRNTNGALSGGIRRDLRAVMREELPTMMAELRNEPPPAPGVSPAGEGPSTATMPAGMLG